MSVRTAVPTTPTSARTGLPKSSVGGAPGAETQVKSLKDLDAAFKQFLYENQSVSSQLEKIEQKTGAKREHVAYGALVVLALYLIVGSAAELVANLIGFAYPAYASVKAIRTENKDDDTLWLTYWSVFGFFSILDFWTENIMRVFPVYLLLKTGFLLHLSLPQTRGAQVVYAKVVDPAVSRIEAQLAAKNQ
ncbi:Receptor expression-enhancing protein [Aphelenchoides bicaudatus]|nr:Receptor expression-enhancing protein [Aphelenchoides bicaudatus]